MFCLKKLEEENKGKNVNNLGNRSSYSLYKVADDHHLYNILCIPKSFIVGVNSSVFWFFGRGILFSFLLFPVFEQLLA